MLLQKDIVMSSAGITTTRLATPQRWEYHVLSLTTSGFLGPKVDIQSLYVRLNELGEQGWEVVSAAPITIGEGRTQEVMFVLKRPVV